MEVQIKDRQAVEATVEVSLTAAEVDAAYDSVLKDLAGQVRIPGFRPGKVPPAILIKRVGEEAIDKEVRDVLMEKNTRAALARVELEPLDFHFHGDTPKRGEPFTYSIHADLVPEFSLPALDEIILDTVAAPISDEEVNATVERMRRENSILVPVDRPAQPTDVVLIETVSADADSEEPGSTMPIELDTASPQLAEQLLGVQVGDEVELVFTDQTAGSDEDEGEDEDLELLEDLADAAGLGELADALADAEEAAEAAEAEEAEEAAAADEAGGEGPAGAEAATPEPTRIKVRIIDVKERDLPDADEDFAKTLGLESWDETLDLIRTTLQEQSDAAAFEDQKAELIEKLLVDNDFPVPPGMVGQRRRFLLSRLEEDLTRRNISVASYLQNLEEKGQLEEFEQDMLNSAAASVRRDLVLERLMIERQTTLTNDEFNEALEEMAAREGITVRALRREQGEEWLANLRFVLARDKALAEAVRERVAAAAVAAIE
jgi:trigger factor